MSPSRNPDSVFSLDGETTAVSSTPVSSSATRSRVPKRGFFVPITESGKLDVDRVRDTEGLEKARAALGVVDPASLPPKEPIKIKSEYILPAYSVLEVLIRFAGRKLLKWPNELAQEMYFSPEKKQALVAPTAEVLSRYAPTWLVDNQDFAALAAALTDAVDDMVNGGVARYMAKKQAASPSPSPSGQPAPSQPPPPRQERTFTGVPVGPFPPIPDNGVSVSA